MDNITIYHNPRCSKSRQTLALIEARGITPQQIRYLESPPTVTELKTLLGKLGISARELLRTGEEEYRALGLSDASLPEDTLLRAMTENPRLIQRPIVVHGDRAVLGRPPENVEQLL